MSSLTLANDQAQIVASLRRLDGRATIGDLVSDTGLAADTVRETLKSVIERHQGHLEVADSGELVYSFDKRLIERGTEPWLARAAQAFKRVATSTFKASISVMLVVYFVIFVALVIAAIFASQRGGDGRGGWSGRGRGGFNFDPLLWYWLWSPRWRIGRPYYGHRWERTLDKDDRVPFYKKVFAFVFGPDQPKPSQRQLDRGALRLIRARSGVLTAAELIEHSGTTIDEAESEMGRLLGAYDGEAVAAPNGEVVYAFPGLMASVDNRRRLKEPNPAWLRLEPPQELTGNSTTTDVVVAGMNAFTMAASATAPWFIFPRLGIGGPAAFIGLVLVPLVFSVFFFAAPAVRMAGVWAENGRRRRRNIRRLVLAMVYRQALDDRAPMSEAEVHTFVAGKLPDAHVTRTETDAALQSVAAEFEAEVAVADDGEVRYAFPEVRAEFTASESVRSRLRLDQRSLGEIVFHTGDSENEAGERELALFDRALLDGGAELTHYLPTVDRVGYEDDFELVAFDEELASSTRSGSS